MAVVEKLRDILSLAQRDIMDLLKDEIVGQILYGSFAYRDIEQHTHDYDSLNSVLDKKPDFIVIVDNLETSIKKILQRTVEKRNINTSKQDLMLEELMNFRRDSPFYFIINTKHSYPIKLNNQTKSSVIQYKVGIIDTPGFFEAIEMNDDNIYLASRLSKPFNTLRLDEAIEKDFKEGIKNVRDYFARLTVRTLPKRFTGEQYVRQYLLATYLGEVYRVFDFIKTKHKKILDGTFYNLDSNETRKMGDELKEMLAPLLYSITNVAVKHIDYDFFNSVFEQKHNVSRILSIPEFYSYNRTSAEISFDKNRKTNKLVGGNNLAYVLRKIRL